MTEESEKPHATGESKLNPEVGDLLDELIGPGKEKLAIPEAIKEVAEQEGDLSRENPWFDYYNDIDSYEKTFRDVLGEARVVDYLRERMRQGRGAVVMDLMGPGFVLRSLPYTAALAVTLGDRRPDEQKAADIQRNLTVIAGDVREKQEEIRVWLQEQNAAGFDLILCRPMKGYDALPRDNDTYYSLIESAWETLSSDEGMLLFEVPRYKQKVIRNWAKKLDGIPNVRALFKENLLIIKETNSPDMLPTL